MVNFITREFTSALDYLNALRLSNREWWTLHSITDRPDREWQRGWFFRGQNSLKKWTLLPTSWRSGKDGEPNPIETLKQYITANTSFSYFVNEALQDRKIIATFPPKLLTGEEEKSYKTRLAEVTLQAIAEATFINEFIELASELGYRIPSTEGWTTNIDDFIKDYISCFFEDSYESWWGRSVLAVAQHHGIKTRLIDWTRNPLVAAFFAADEADKQDIDDHIVVYAIHAEILKYHIKTISPSMWEDEYFRAQSAIFTLDTMADKLYMLNGKYPSLEESLQLLPAEFNPVLHPQKLVLPVSEAPALLRLLWPEKVTRAHLMPTLDYVAAAVKSKLHLVNKIDMELFSK